LYSSDPDADRTFFRDVLGFRSVDAGHGWLIFALPPAELAVHPVEGTPGSVRTDHELLRAELYLMCDDLDAAVARLAASQVRCSGVESAQWGRHTTVQLPSGGRIGLYQPTHPTAIGA
jgi:catechol 2,3-dioxygenase-like lactoylglutathione lyase family enzyme